MARFPRAWGSSSAGLLTVCTSSYGSAARDSPMPDETRALDHIEFRARHELGMRDAIIGRKADRRIRPGAGMDRLGRSSHELDVQKTSLTTTYPELRSVRYGPFGAEVERGTPTALIDGQQFDPDFHIADGAVGIHAPLPSLPRGLRSSP